MGIHQTARAANKTHDEPAAFTANYNGRKQWLTRKDIEEEYGWSPKTTARIEHAANSKLIPTQVGKNGGRTKRYFRPHIEALLRANFSSVRALNDTEEVL